VTDALLVDLIVRDDAFSKPGGDMVQVAEYARILTARGDDVRVVPFEIALRFRPGALVHYFNVDRLFETLEVQSAARDRQFFVSSIHHSMHHLSIMRRADPSGGLARQLSRLPEPFRAFLVYALRVLKDPRVSLAMRLAAVGRGLARLPCVRRRIGRALDAANHVFLLSLAEEGYLREDFGWQGLNGSLTPNGLPGFSTGRGRRPSERKGKILVVGRIEARKRQLEVLQLADELGIAVTFVGGANPNQMSYVSRFDQELSASCQSQWLNELSHSDVVQLMRESTVLLNASWLEVQSLVDLEAAACGCQVVTVKNGGSSKEWLGDVVTEFGGGALREALCYAASIKDTERDAAPLAYTPTWESSVTAIQSVYRRTPLGETRVSH
jgi:glycosyltransferase involved in cell wall biosynthesis